MALQLFAFCYHEKSRVSAGWGSAEKINELYMREKGIFILSRRQFHPEKAVCSRQEQSPLPSVCCQRAPSTGAQRHDTCQSEQMVRVRVLRWFSASSERRGVKGFNPQPFTEGDERTDESAFRWPVSHQAAEPGLAKNSKEKGELLLPLVRSVLRVNSVRISGTRGRRSNHKSINEARESMRWHGSKGASLTESRF